MNYYPFHIGDYLSATRHLTWEEDCAFRRLLDTYYVTEKPLPDDLRQVYRLVLATTDVQREAVKVVLNEFFEHTPNGWINSRADSEIRSMRDKQEANEVRDSHERERMRRHRERRAEMFAALRAIEIVPPWDVSIKELQRLHDEHCNAPATDLQREQVVSGNAPATGIPTPTPTPDISTDVDIKDKRAARFDAQAHLVSLGVDPQVAKDWISHRQAKKAKPTLTAIDGIVREVAKARIALSDALSISCRRGWVSFEADWILKDRPPAKTQNQINQDATTRALFGSARPAERLISGEVVQ